MGKQPRTNWIDDWEKRWERKNSSIPPGNIRRAHANVTMILNFLTPKLPGEWKHTFSASRGATSHTARISMNALFPGHVISRNEDCSWHRRSLYLTTILKWANLKSKVFEANPPKTILALKQRIRDEIEADWYVARGHANLQVPNARTHGGNIGNLANAVKKFFFSCWTSNGNSCIH